MVQSVDVALIPVNQRREPGTTPEEYAASLKADAGRYSKAVKLSGAKAD